MIPVLVTLGIVILGLFLVIGYALTLERRLLRLEARFFNERARTDTHRSLLQRLADAEIGDDRKLAIPAELLGGPDDGHTNHAPFDALMVGHQGRTYRATGLRNPSGRWTYQLTKPAPVVSPAPVLRDPSA